MTREEIIKAFVMRVDGFTFEQIGQEYGVSKQSIQQALNNVVNGSRRVSRYTHYRNLIIWLEENGISATRFAKQSGITPYILRGKLKEGRSFTQKEIIRICKNTGLSFEQLVEGEYEDD
jgi:transcriptional regulator with XRE-family HTH domain